MNRRKRLGWVAGVAVVLGVVSTAAAQEGGPPQPTAQHKVFASDVGTWDGTIKAYFAGPDAEPTVSKGTETNSMLTGGFWLVSSFKGEFGGQPFEGRGQFGYDPLKKKYVGTWVDSMSPTLSVLEGSYDPTTRTMTYEGDGTDPVSKSKYKQKMVTVTRDDDHRVFTLFMTSDATGGKEAKFMEITYTRRK